MRIRIGRISTPLDGLILPAIVAASLLVCLRPVYWLSGIVVLFAAYLGLRRQRMKHDRDNYIRKGTAFVERRAAARKASR